MTQRLFGAVVAVIALAIVAPLTLLGSGESIAASASLAPTATDLHASAEPAQLPSPDDVMAMALQTAGTVESLGSVAFVDPTVVCGEYSGNCEPAELCRIDNITLGHAVDNDIINLVIAGTTTCQGGRLEWTPVVGGEPGGINVLDDDDPEGTDDGEILRGQELIIRNLNAGAIEIRSAFATNNCGLGSTIDFEVAYYRGTERKGLATTATVPLAICAAAG